MSHGEPNTFPVPNTSCIRVWVCEQQIWCFTFCVGSFVICLQHACGNLRGSSHFSLCVWLCVCPRAWASELSCPAVYMLTTLILYVEPLDWEPTHSASPRASSPLSLSLRSVSAETLCAAERWKSHKFIHDSTSHLSFHWILKIQWERPWVGQSALVFSFCAYTFAETHHFPPARCTKQGHGLLWWTKKPIRFLSVTLN